MSVTNRLCINSRKSHHSIQMSIGKVLFLYIAERIHVCKGEILLLRTLQDGSTLCCIEEFSFLIQELESIPLLRIMGGCKYNTAVRFFENHSHLSCRGRSKTCLHHIDSARHSRSTYKLLDHITGKSGILSDNDLIPFTIWLRTAFLQFFTISICKLNDIDR